MKTDNGSEKEFYRLWVEYLKRNGDYKELLEWGKKNKKNPSLPLPDKLKHRGTGLLGNILIFGKIHDKRWTFEKWWQYYEKRQLLTSKKELLPNGFPVSSYVARKVLGVTEEFHPKRTVEDYADYIQGDIDDCIQQFKFYNKGKEPTLNELKERFLYELKQGILSQHITIRIDPRGETIEDILKQVKKIIKEKRKSPQVRKREVDFKAYFKPSTRIRFDELKKYLKVYDLRKQGEKPTDIIKKINPNDDPDNTEVRRAYRGFYSKAKKIIRFTEYGIFPGPYDKPILNLKKRNDKTPENSLL